MIRIGTILLFVFFSFSLNAQWAFRGLEASNTITIAIKDTIYNFHVRLQEKEVKPVTSRRYYWFHEGDLKTTQGSYRGKLLHGVMEKLDRNGALLEKGEFEDGLKTGKWLTWYTNGNLTGRYQYKNGIRSGKFEEYYPSGVVQRSGYFSNDKINGMVRVYSTDGIVLSKIRFKDGAEVFPKEKKERKVRKAKEEQETNPADTSSRKKKKFFQKKKKEDALNESESQPVQVVPSAAPVKNRRKSKKQKQEEQSQSNN